MARDSKELLEVEDSAVEVLTQNLGWTEIVVQLPARSGI